MQHSTGPQVRGSVLALVGARLRAEKRYHKAKGRRARQLAFAELLAIKQELNRYAAASSTSAPVAPIGTEGR